MESSLFLNLLAGVYVGAALAMLLLAVSLLVDAAIAHQRTKRGK